MKKIINNLKIGGHILGVSFLLISLRILALAILLTFVLKYNPPEGFTKEHHTYKEIYEFAQRLDSDAKVSEQYNDTFEKEGNHYYREWPAVINGIPCHVSSVTTYVFNEGFLGGEFCKPYYRIDTDYDYYLLRQILSENQPEWKLSYPEDDIMARYNPNSVLSVNTSYYQSDRLSDSELEDFWQKSSAINNLYLTYPVNDRLYFELRAPIRHIIYAQKYSIDPDATILLHDFSEEGKKKFFELYNERWNLLDNDISFD